MSLTSVSERQKRGKNRTNVRLNGSCFWIFPKARPLFFLRFFKRQISKMTSVTEMVLLKHKNKHAIILSNKINDNKIREGKIERFQKRGKNR